MKNTIKYLALFLVSISITLVSCDGGDSDDENPIAEECMDFVALPNDYDYIIHIVFADETNGWAIGKTGLTSHDLLHTTDAGANWQVIDEDFEMDFDNGYMSGETLQFVNATNGIKKTTYISGDKLKIQYTTDSGATWHDYNNTFVDINGNPDQEYGLPSFFASNGTETILMSGGTTYASGWTYKTMIRINNSTMQVIEAINEHYSSSMTQYPITIDRVLHYSENGIITALVTSNSDYTGDLFVAQSTDKGETWVFTTDVLSDSYYNSSSWVSDTIGYFTVGDTIGAKSIYKTIDGGATWSIINANPPEFQMIRFVNENNGVGVTDFDFHYTTDGGTTWTEVCKDNYYVVFDEVVAYPSINNAWVSGSKLHENYVDSDKGIFIFTGE